MPYITHPDGVRTFYREDDFTNPWESSETILIQHGFGRSSAFWYAWVPVLAKKYRVIRRDALGHGYSSGAPAGNPLTPDSYLDELIDTLDHLKIDKVHYLGESTAGIFAHLLAARNPDRLLSAATCGSPLTLDKAAQETPAFGYPDCPTSVRELGARGWGEKFIKLSGTDKSASEGFLSWWLEQFSIPETEGMAQYAEIVTNKEADARRVAHHVRVPIMMLTPANSALIDIDDAKAYAKIANAKVEIIHGHGHEIYLDQAEACQKAYLKFLSEIKV